MSEDAERTLRQAEAQQRRVGFGNPAAAFHDETFEALASRVHAVSLRGTMGDLLTQAATRLVRG